MLCGLIATSLIASGDSPLDVTMVITRSLVSLCLAPSSELVNIVEPNGLTIVGVTIVLFISDRERMGTNRSAVQHAQRYLCDVTCEQARTTALASAACVFFCVFGFASVEDTRRFALCFGCAHVELTVSQLQGGEPSLNARFATIVLLCRFGCVVSIIFCPFYVGSLCLLVRTPRALSCFIVHGCGHLSRICALEKKTGANWAAPAVMSLSRGYKCIGFTPGVVLTNASPQNVIVV